METTSTPLQQAIGLLKSVAVDAAGNPVEGAVASVGPAGVNVGGACQSEGMASMATPLQQAIGLLKTAVAHSAATGSQAWAAGADIPPSVLLAEAAEAAHLAHLLQLRVLEATASATTTDATTHGRGATGESTNTSTNASTDTDSGVLHDPASEVVVLGVAVDELIAVERLANQIAGVRAVAVDRLRRLSEAVTAVRVPERVHGWTAAEVSRREVATEIAAALRITENHAGTLVAEARLLVHDLPATFAAVQAGDVGWAQATVIAGTAAGLPVELRGPFEDRLLPATRRLTVQKLKVKVRTAMESFLPESLTARHVKAMADRRVYVEGQQNGMATLSIESSAEIIVGIYNKLTGRAKQLRGERAQTEETRTLAQLRADVATDLLVDGHTDGDWPVGVQATVIVTVPALTLTDRIESPGSVEGYGPIDADTARRLAGTSKGWYRFLTDPETGIVLSHGRSRYKVPDALRLFLRIRDGTCRHPGCNRPASHSEIDHTLAWENGGTTDADNLACRCGGDHAVKHHTAWDVEQLPDGMIVHTSPAGKQYPTYPAEITLIPPPGGFWPEHDDPPPDPMTNDSIDTRDPGNPVEYWPEGDPRRKLPPRRVSVGETERLAQIVAEISGIPPVEVPADQGGPVGLAAIWAALDAADDRDDRDLTPTLIDHDRTPRFEPTPASNTETEAVDPWATVNDPTPDGSEPSPF